MKIDQLDIIYDFFIISPGFTMTIFMILSYLKYKNIYFGLFTLTYVGTGIMAFVFLIKFDLLRYEAGIVWDLIEMFCMLFILEGSTWLVMKLFHDRMKIFFKICIVLIGFIPLLTYTITWSFFSNYLVTIYHLNYLFLFGVLGINCMVFGLNYRKIKPSTNRKFSVLFWILLLIFLIIFITQRIGRLNFNPLLPFYFIWSVLLIWFSWKHILSTGLSKLFHVQTSFVQQYNITKREEEIIELIIKGYKNSKISELLFISEKTVTNHLYNIYKKLGISSRFELICLFKN